jgi:RNA polymerase sigma-70 factor (ECF subfamily)
MEDFEQLYLLYSKQLFSYLLFKCGDRYLAEEMLQETFYQAIKSIFRFKGESKVSTWLYQISNNIYLKNLTRLRKEQVSPLEELNVSDESDPPDVLLEAKESTQEVINGINRLKEPFKEIVFLRSYNELSFKEIGGIFNQSEGWARTNFYRAKLLLKEYLISQKEEL